MDKTIPIYILVTLLIIAGCTQLSPAKTTGASTEFIPPGNINGMGIYTIYNFNSINTSELNFTSMGTIRFNTSSNHTISDNATCIVIKGSTTTTNFC